MDQVGLINRMNEMFLGDISQFEYVRRDEVMPASRTSSAAALKLIRFVCKYSIFPFGGPVSLREEDE